jgi:hypothetical protein
MARVSPTVFRFVLLLTIPSLVDAAPRVPLQACASLAQERGAVLPSSDIDYPGINRLLQNPDASQRLLGLPAEIRRLDISKAPEARLVRHRLQLAMAQTQSKLGLTTAAMTSLKSIPATSPQAPEALLMLAELEVKNGRPKAAVRWLRQMAELFPDETLAIQGLWRAAELNYPHSRQAIALWQQAARQADAALASAQTWHARSQQPDFLDKVNGEKLSPELWRLARAALTDPAFASADAVQSEVRRQLQCLTTTQDAQLRRLEKNPRLLADLNETVESLTSKLQAARNEISQREKAFSAVAQQLKECGAQNTDCSDTQMQNAKQADALSNWRRQAQGLEAKISFLRDEEKSLRNSPQDSGGNVSSQLASHLSNTRSFMQKLLQQSLADAVQDWEALSAEAHYRLAVAQEPRIHPGLVPKK